MIFMDIAYSSGWTARTMAEVTEVNWKYAAISMVVLLVVALVILSIFIARTSCKSPMAKPAASMANAVHRQAKQAQGAIELSHPQVSIPESSYNSIWKNEWEVDGMDVEYDIGPSDLSANIEDTDANYNLADNGTWGQSGGPGVPQSARVQPHKVLTELEAKRNKKRRDVIVEGRKPQFLREANGGDLGFSAFVKATNSGYVFEPGTSTCNAFCARAQNFTGSDWEQALVTKYSLCGCDPSQQREAS